MYRSLTRMPAWLHSFMQHANHLDQVGTGDAIEDDMDRPSDRRFATLGAAVANMKAAEPRREFVAIHRGGSSGITGNPAQRRCQEAAIADAGLGPVAGLARAQAPLDVGFSRAREPITKAPGRLNPTTVGKLCQSARCPARWSRIATASLWCLVSAIVVSTNRFDRRR